MRCFRFARERWLPAGGDVIEPKSPTPARRRSPPGPADRTRGGGHERLSWLKPGAVGGPRRVSLERYMVRCSHCLRQPCSHGPYTKLVIGTHKRVRRTRIHIPRQIVDVVIEGVRLRQRVTASQRRAVAMVWGHYWQVRIYTPWRWIPAKDWWPTSRLAKMRAAARDPGGQE